MHPGGLGSTTPAMERLRAAVEGQAICLPLYSCTQSIRLFPGPKELLEDDRAGKLLLAGKQKTNLNESMDSTDFLEHKFEPIVALCNLVPTAENWEHVERARVQLKLLNKTQMTSHTCSLLHKHLHTVLSDNAFRMCW